MLQRNHSLFVVVVAAAAFAGSACVTPRLDRPSSARVMDGDDEAAVSFSSRSVEVSSLVYTSDEETKRYVARELNRAAAAPASAPEAPTKVAVSPAVGAPLIGAASVDATLVSETPAGTVTTTKSASVGSAPLKTMSMVANSVGFACAMAGLAITPLNVGAIPTLALASVGLLALGTGGALGLVNTMQEEKDASDLLARAIQEHGEAVAVKTKQGGAVADAGAD